MKLLTKSYRFHKNVVIYISEAIKAILYVLSFIGLSGIAYGTFLAGKHLYSNRGPDLGFILQTLVIDIIIILAVLEVVRTILSYLSEGRVRVSLIIDTVMIITLNEIVKLWFERGPHVEAFYLVGVTAVLMGLRILAIRYGPSQHEKGKQTK